MTDQSSRDVLPIPDRPYEGELPLDAKDPEATFPPIEPLLPPAGSPHVLVVLLDDVGFAASSAFASVPPSAAVCLAISGSSWWLAMKARYAEVVMWKPSGTGVPSVGAS